ncbi:MAG TPA: Gfo/Idh/MocA family oxidoreductase [Rhodanobacteraceae bacterium]|nr:Gfo/Idh/MocA family oxidoreductase [Rhodanobacteraceae bacterium]
MNAQPDNFAMPSVARPPVGGHAPPSQAPRSANQAGSQLLPARPRLGFLGVGWIGRQRMQCLLESGLGEVVAVADQDGAALHAAASLARGARAHNSYASLLGEDLDGLVIATPSGAHARQAIEALECGLAVFCQKPLTRTAQEARDVIECARRSDRLLQVDFSYRHVAGVSRVRELISRGELGEIYAIELAFHNAYGPDKPWFRDIRRSGGGCVMDLGIHLIDLACWITGCTRAQALEAQLFAHGRTLAWPIHEVEDYASVQWRQESGACVRMVCSWNLPAGCDAQIEASFYGTKGGASLRNVAGSFYDFTVDRFRGTHRENLASPPDSWGGRALLAWAERLAIDPTYDDAAEHLVDVAAIVDHIYGR